MDESVLWAVALWSGAFGLLLLVVGGVAAVYLNARARRLRDAAPTGKPRSRAGDVAATDESQPRVQSSDAQHTTARSPLAWVKAWIYAFLHAGVVSVVLGGITFFEDLSRASDEIHRTGTVTFPQQLLPGTLSGPMSKKLLSNTHQHEATGDDADAGERVQSGAAPPDAASAWEVVDSNGVGASGAD